MSMTEIRRYASTLLHQGIDRLVNEKHPPHRYPGDGVVCEELNGICQDLLVGIEFRHNKNGVDIGIGSDEDALRALEVLYIFSATYPSLLLPPGPTVSEELEDTRMDQP